MTRDPGTDGVNSFKTCGISNDFDFGTDSEDDSDADGE